MPDRLIPEQRGRPVEDPVELTRRRFARRQWARRWLAWRVVLGVVIAVATVVGGVWLVFFSSVLAIDGVDVQGNRLLTESEVQRAAAVPTGEPLARADVEAIAARIEALPAVASVDVSRAWPDRILVQVVEREAVAVIDDDGRLRGMDAEGVVFREFKTLPKTLPRLKIAPDTRGEAMAEGAAVVGVLPADIVAKIDFVDVKTVDQISLQLRDGRTVVWGSADESEQKARVLDVLLRQRFDVYDVSVPGQPTTR
jgi:cell division protein FtsQ